MSTRIGARPRGSSRIASPWPTSRTRTTSAGWPSEPEVPPGPPTPARAPASVSDAASATAPATRAGRPRHPGRSSLRRRERTAAEAGREEQPERRRDRDAQARLRDLELRALATEQMRDPADEPGAQAAERGQRLDAGAPGIWPRAPASMPNHIAGAIAGSASRFDGMAVSETVPK